MTPRQERLVALGVRALLLLLSVQSRQHHDQAELGDPAEGLQAMFDELKGIEDELGPPGGGPGGGPPP